MLLDAIQAEQQASLPFDDLIEKKEHAPGADQNEAQQNAAVTPFTSRSGLMRADRWDKHV
ncbi:MAG: hypothetical protein WA624_14095 [Methylocella sp.]